MKVTYLGSSRVSQKTPVPLFHNLEIWNLKSDQNTQEFHKCKPFRSGKMNGVVDLQLRNMFGKNKITGLKKSAKFKLSPG